MHKHNPCGMQIQPVCAAAIEVVASDGTAEPFRVGAVHAQLMRATCERMEFHNVFIDNELLVDYLDPSPLLHGWFAFRTTWSHTRLTGFSIKQTH